MLAVSKEYRKRKIGSTLVLMAIESMKTAGADEVNKMQHQRYLLPVLKDSMGGSKE